MKKKRILPIISTILLFGLLTSGCAVNNGNSDDKSAVSKTTDNTNTKEDKKTPKKTEPVVTATPPTQFGKGFTFYVDGTSLKDKNGNDFVMRGVNVPNFWFDSQGFSAFENVAKTGANTVRVVWGNTGSAYRLDEILAEVKRNKMIAIPELHDVTGKTSTDDVMRMVSYWTRDDIKAVLEKYKDSAIVNICNEWGDHTVSNQYWGETYEKAVKAMRDAGVSNTILVDAGGWGQNADTIINEGVNVKAADFTGNTMFSVHMYGSFNNPSTIGSKLQAIKDKNLTVIVGEFGYNYNNGSNNLGCKVDADEILKQCKEKNIGYLAWSWFGNNAENQWLDLLTDWNGEFTKFGDKIVNSPNGIKATSNICSIYNQ